jgi:small multidrug resistance pump
LGRRRRTETPSAGRARSRGYTTSGGREPCAVLLSTISRSAIPVGVVYAIWSGLGIVLIAAVGAVWFRQPLDLPAVLGLDLILARTVVVNLFSKTVGH